MDFEKEPPYLDDALSHPEAVKPVAVIIDFEGGPNLDHRYTHVS